MLSKIGEITPPCFTPVATVKCVEMVCGDGVTRYCYDVTMA